MKTNMGLPEIDFVSYLWKKGILFNFGKKKLVKIQIFSPKKSPKTWDT